MKALDLKSVITGAAFATLVLLLTASKSSQTDDVKQLVGTPAGIAIYNSQTKTLYLYTMTMGSLNQNPGQVFAVSEDGSSLTKARNK